MNYCYSNNGNSMRAVDPDYVAQTGEVLFNHLPTDAEIVAAFPSYVAPDSAAGQATALAIKIDADVDAVYRATMGARASEYELAESDAKAYVAAGYTGTVPASVSSWATATGQTDQWAADNIISTANAWRSAQANMRAERLAKKQALKATGITQAIVTQIAADWATFIANVRSQLGL